MRRTSLFVLVFIMALSAFSLGVGLSYDANPFADDDTETVEGTDTDGEGEGEGEGEEEEEKEPVERFTVEGVMYHVTEEGVVEVEGVEEGATSIVIPKEVTYEEENYKVTAITEDAFTGNKALTSVTIEGSIKEIHKEAFKGCTSLTTIALGKGVEVIGESAFDGCTSLKTIDMAESVEKIGDSAFAGCTSLTTVELGKGVKEIGESAFEGCTSLKTIDIAKGVEKIGDSVFDGCSKLESVAIPESVKELGKDLFKDCTKLKTVEIDCDVEEINKDLFKNCTSLEEIEIKGDIKTVEESVFEGNEKLKSVKLSGDIDEIGKNAFKDCTKLETFEFGEKKKVKVVGESAFEGCSSLKAITIPGSLKVIEKTTFKDCTSLKDLVIKPGVEEIGESAFEGCTSLEEITIPSTVKKVGEKAFKDCTSLTKVELEEGVEEIGNSAFEGCGELKMVSIPASVVDIGESVFDGSSLEEVTIPGSMKMIKDGAFKGCKELKKLTIEEGVEEIGNSAFADCTSLPELIIPNSMKKIGNSAFKNCEKIDSLKLGDGLKEMGDSVFAGCLSLPLLVLPKDITELATASFLNCEKLDSISLSEDLKKIGESVFEGCKVLPAVYLPESLEAIEKAAFKGCDSLKWVQVEFKEPFKIDLSVFEGISEQAVLKVPKGTRATYMKEESWASQFAKIVGGEYKVTIISSGNGQAVCLRDSVISDSLVIRNDSVQYTFMEGDSVLVAFESDAGYQIMDVTVNDKVISDSIFADIYAADTLTTEKPRFGEYTVAYVDQDYQVAVAYEKIHYRLIVTSIGKGSVNFEGEAVEDTTKVFRIEDGVEAFITFSPGENWRIKQVMIDSLDITSELAKYQYSIKNIKKNTMLVAEYEEIPVNKYILTLYVSGNGEVTVDGNTTVRERSWSAYFNEDTTAVLTFIPDEGYTTKYLRVNGADVTSAIVNNQYTLSSIRADINVNVSFAAMEMTFEKDGIHYLVTSFADKKVTVTAGDNLQTLEVPATVAYGDNVWEVTGIREDALAGCPDLAAVIWNPSTQFKATVSNPNFLLYVSDAKYVAWEDQNAVVDGVASNIILTDGKEGNDFYCPRSFTAEKITYTHNYTMETGIMEPRGWETIALPYDVQTIKHATAGVILPFKKWTTESEEKPFWLYELTGSGYQEAEGIKANTPYIISMPNNSLYLTDYRLIGKVTFESENVEVKNSRDLNSARYSDRTLVPNFVNKSDEAILPLNVNNDIVTYTQSDMGSKFVKGLRPAYPFEAYMTTTSNTRSIGVLDGMTTGIQTLKNMVDETSQGVRVYDMRGVLVKSSASMAEVRNGLKPGVYVVQGKKIIIKR